MHDFLVYGIVSSLVTKGYLGYPICGLGTKSCKSCALAKNVWDYMHRRYLSFEHVWQTKEFAHLFNGEAEHSLPPTRIMLDQHIQYGRL